MKGWNVALALISMAASVAPAMAGESATAAFPKGTFSLQAYTTYAGGIDAEEIFNSGAIGASYYVFDNFSLGVEASGHRFEQAPGSDGWMYGVAGILRHHLIQFDRSTIFADVTFGPVEATDRVPAGGTYFNFATRAGIGTTYQIQDNLYLIGGVRYFHLSNARIEGPARNPSINGVEGYVGLMLTL
jgi:hypothetical protein